MRTNWCLAKKIEFLRHALKKLQYVLWHAQNKHKKHCNGLMLVWANQASRHFLSGPCEVLQYLRITSTSNLNFVLTTGSNLVDE